MEATAYILTRRSAAVHSIIILPPISSLPNSLFPQAAIIKCHISFSSNTRATRLLTLSGSSLSYFLNLLQLLPLLGPNIFSSLCSRNLPLSPLGCKKRLKIICLLLTLFSVCSHITCSFLWKWTFLLFIKQWTVSVSQKHSQWVMKVIIQWAPVSRLQHWLAATCTQHTAHDQSFLQSNA